QGHHLVSLRDEPDAVLGVRGGVDDRAAARHVDQFVLRRPRGRATVHLRDGVHRAGGRRLPAALLLSRAHRPPLPSEGPPRPQATGKALDTPGTGTVEYAARYGQPDDGLLLLLLLRRSLPTGSDLTFPGAAGRR